ncbi:MAG: SDR family NAD(P)-dependent oxidoreductase [Thaumarchaeota archaeon]|nr:SDR family NAD(P)-dependent oxidoreductase [Nitrososphaerota archaeon]
MRVSGNIAIVTGASSDIGKGVAKRLVEEGASVILIARNLERLEQARDEIGNKELTASMPCDITDESQVMQTVNQIIDTHGKIDILVNNAGAINDPVHFHEMKQPDIEKLIGVNMFGIFHMTKAVLAKMTDAKKGAIVNIGSISGNRAIPRVHLAAYSSTKAAVAMFTKAIAVEYARKNIRCNCVSPGIINSGMIKPYLDDPHARKVIEERIPLVRIGEPRDVANAVLFLASEEANWITGVELNVDGGKTASEG